MTDFSSALSVSASGMRAQAQRLNHVSENIANADTPGYRAKDITEFADVLRDMQRRPEGPEGRLSIRTHDAGTPASPNGNTVSLELEMLRGIEAQRAHSRALRVYGSALEILRTSLGRR